MNLDEYRRMYQHEQTLWWYVGMRAISDTFLQQARLAHSGQDDTWSSRAVGEPIDRTPPRVLDAGCGTGAGLEWLAQYGQTVGLDLSREALALCQERGLDRLVRGSVDRLPVADRSLDLVTSFDVLYHLWVGDAGGAVREAYRVLRPGGYFLVRVPALRWLQGRHDEAVHTRQRYRRGEVVRLLERAGFTIERASYANTLLLPMVAAKRLAERFTRDGSSDLESTPGWLNQSFTLALKLEAKMLHSFDLPIGVSVVALARRPVRAAADVRR